MNFLEVNFPEGESSFRAIMVDPSTVAFFPTNKVVQGIVPSPFVYRRGCRICSSLLFYFLFIPVNMVMAKAKTVAQAQNLCCFMDAYPLAGPSLPLFLYYTKLT